MIIASILLNKHGFVLFIVLSKRHYCSCKILVPQSVPCCLGFTYMMFFLLYVFASCAFICAQSPHVSFHGHRGRRHVPHFNQHSSVTICIAVMWCKESHVSSTAANNMNIATFGDKSPMSLPICKHLLQSIKDLAVRLGSNMPNSGEKFQIYFREIERDFDINNFRYFLDVV